MIRVVTTLVNGEPEIQFTQIDCDFLLVCWSGLHVAPGECYREAMNRHGWQWVPKRRRDRHYCPQHRKRHLLS